MNQKWFVLILLVLCFTVSSYGLCAGSDPNALTVRKIVFSCDKAGTERIAVVCNQACVPDLSSVEGENPRVVMDMKGVSLIQTKVRSVATGGKLVKKVRSYLDKKTNTLRVVLDLEPSKYHIVRPIQGTSGNTYELRIQEASPLSKQKPGEKNEAENSIFSKDMHVKILRPEVKAAEQEKELKKAASRAKTPKVIKAAKDIPSVDQGRSQMNAGQFASAVETFTRIIAADPKDSLSYRLRGNAYDNLNDRQKATEDWIQAARLDDTAMQSYLDFLQVKWR